MRVPESLYPIDLKLLSDHREAVSEVFRKVRPHKGAFVGVCELEGCFLCDSAGELFESLEFGERLSLFREKGKKRYAPLAAVRKDGTAVGNLPFSDAILPNLLIERGINVYCYIEAKEFNGGMFAVAVSIYSDKY